MTQSTTPSSAPYVCPVCGQRSFNLYGRACDRYIEALSAHTPGPWHVDTSSPYARYCIKPYPGPIVCDLCPVDDDDSACDASGFVTLANARLIAAAPDLLCECRTQLENWRMLQTGQWDGSAEGVQAAIESLETVIARATRTDTNPNAS